MSDTTGREGETHNEWSERVNRPARIARRARMEATDWEPTYSPWRHGGHYVDNLVYPDGAVGCIVSPRNSPSGKFQIACGSWEIVSETYSTRKAAAFAEREHAMQLWRDWDANQLAPL